MSLLLDALQRASKEKERLAANTANPAAKPSAAPRLDPASLLTALSAANRPPPEAPVVNEPGVSVTIPEPSGDPLPPLSFDFKIDDAPLAESSQPEADPAATSGLEALTFTAEPLPSPAADIREASYESDGASASYDFTNLSTVPIGEEPSPPPVASWETGTPSVSEPPAEPGSSQTEPQSMQAKVETSPPSIDASTSVNVSPPETESTVSAPAISPYVPQAIPSHSESGGANIARDLIEAAAPPRKTKYKKADIFFVVAAVVVASLTASLYLGLWDSYLGLSDSNVVPATTTEAPPAPEQTDAVPTDTTAEVASPEVPVTEETGPRFKVTSPKPETSTNRSTKVPSVTGQQPLFTARTAGPTALESGYTALNEGRLDDAADAYRRAMRNNSEERDALLGLAYIAARQGQTDEARSYYQRVLRQEPDNPVAGSALLALAAEGDLGGAASRARDMVERYPDSAAAFSTLGNILVREGRIADAQQAYFKAMTLEPDDPFHVYNLAVALDRLHKTDHARGFYEKAVALADKTGATTRRNFPRDAAMQRLEQLRSPVPSIPDAPKPGLR